MKTSQNQPHRIMGYPEIFLLVFGFLLLISVGVFHLFPPKPVALSAPTTVFSSSRALLLVQKIGAVPHPTGSANQHAVRHYLLEQLKQRGLQPEIQSVMLFNPRINGFTQIENIVARIPGNKQGKSLLLSAHYDSVARGPGAADDGASVAALLETINVIKSHRPLQNDLIFLFTDSEEAGLLGAKAFVEKHPLAKTIGMVLNFEYRGNSGAFLMFETSAGNGQLIEGLAQSVPYIMATSLMVDVYQYLPNDTDFTVFKNAGIPGMNFAAIGGHKAYHTRLDRPEYLNQGSLQHQGEIMTALVSYFGNLNLVELQAENRQYFDFPGFGLIHYPKNWLLPLFAILICLYSRCVFKPYQTKEMRVWPTIGAAAGFLLSIVMLYFFNSGLWLIVKHLHPHYQAFAFFDVFKSYCYLLGFILLNTLLVFGFFQSARRWLWPMELNLGVATVWLLLVAITLNFGANFMFYWPLFAYLTMLTLVRIPYLQSRSLLTAVVLLIGSAPALLIYIPFLNNLFVGLTLNALAIILIFCNLLLGLLFPLLAFCSKNGDEYPDYSNAPN